MMSLLKGLVLGPICVGTVLCGVVVWILGILMPEAEVRTLVQPQHKSRIVLRGFAHFFTHPSINYI